MAYCSGRRSCGIVPGDIPVDPTVTVRRSLAAAPGGERLGNVTIVISIFSWIRATIVLAARYSVDIGTDTVVLAAAAVSVLAWYKAVPSIPLFMSCSWYVCGIAGGLRHDRACRRMVRLQFLEFLK